MSTRLNGRDDPGESLEGPGDVSGSWVSIAEAARRLGISPRAVRLRIDRRQMKWRPVGNQGREVWLAVGDVPADRTGDSPGLPGTESLLQARVEELLERAARAEGEVAGLHATVAELRAALTKSETRADRLEAALAEARRPWLAKVLDGLRRR